MPRHEHFGDGRHARAIAAQTAQHRVFGRGFEIRAGHGRINAFPGADVVLPRDVQRPGAQTGVVRLRQIGEARAEAFVVGAAQRVVGQQVDVVAHDHEVAGTQVGIHAAGGIGDDEPFDAEPFQHPDRERDLLHRPALVPVKTAGHDHNRMPAEPAENQLARMALHGAGGEMWNVGVVDFGFHRHVAGQAVQPGAEHDAGAGLEVRSGAEEGEGFVDLVVEHGWVWKASAGAKVWFLAHLPFWIFKAITIFLSYRLESAAFRVGILCKPVLFCTGSRDQRLILPPKQKD